MPITSPSSTEILLAALTDHVDKTRTLQKQIAIDAGLAPNFFSMLKGGDSRTPLDRIVGLKRAMPELDAHALTAAVFTEMFPDAAAHEAMVELMNFLSKPDPFEQALIDIAAEIREEDEKSGLRLPDILPKDIRGEIKALLKDAVQRETVAE